MLQTLKIVKVWKLIINKNVYKMLYSDFVVCMALIVIESGNISVRISEHVNSSIKFNGLGLGNRSKRAWYKFWSLQKNATSVDATHQFPRRYDGKTEKMKSSEDMFFSGVKKNVEKYHGFICLELTQSQRVKVFLHI